jgi:hypothetical protein
MKFFIRDVMWLMVVIGLALGWWLEYRGHRLAARQLAALVKVLRSRTFVVNVSSTEVSFGADFKSGRSWRDTEELDPP